MCCSCRVRALSVEDAAAANSALVLASWSATDSIAVASVGCVTFLAPEVALVGRVTVARARCRSDALRVGCCDLVLRLRCLTPACSVTIKVDLRGEGVLALTVLVLRRGRPGRPRPRPRPRPRGRPRPLLRPRPLYPRGAVLGRPRVLLVSGVATAVARSPSAFAGVVITGIGSVRRRVFLRKWRRRLTG